MRAVITIDSFKTREPGYVNFKDKSQKSWNCNKSDIIANLAVGERYYIDYNETAPKPGRQYGSKYINQLRAWRESDGPNTWPDKEPWTGGNSSSGGGGSKMKNDYDPEVGKRQTASNCAANVLAHYVGSTKKLDLDEVAVLYPTLFDIILKQFETKGSEPIVSSPAVSYDFDSDGIDF